MKPYIILGIIVGLLGSLGTLVAQPPLGDIVPGENQFDAISRDQPAVLYRLRAPDEATLVITVRSLAADFAPMLRIYGEDAVLLAQYPNLNAASELRVAFLPDPEVDYELYIQGVDGARGEFVLGVARAIDSDPARLPVLELTIGQQIDDRVSESLPSQRYQFASVADGALRLQLRSSLADGGPSMVLRDAEGVPLAATRADLLGGVFIIPAGVGQIYEVQVVHSGAERDEAYTLALSRDGQGASLTITLTPTPTITPPMPDTATPQPGTPTQTPEARTSPAPTTAPVTPPPSPSPSATIMPGRVVIPDDGPCVVTPLGDVGVNIRRGPGTAFEIIDGLTVNALATVIGRNADNSWWQIEYEDGFFGWVADRAIERGGDCSDIGVATFDAPFSEPGGLPTDRATPTE
ncbi:MAG: SH3 domain-containing protein [Anaerolineales bacterium]